ncbi:LmeA family phospholipid-binding protein [Agromyces soli]
MSEQPDASAAAGGQAAAARSGRSTGRVLLVVLGIVVVLGLLLVVADLIARNIAQQRVAAEIEQQLPDGVEGAVDVRIGGFSVIAQYLSGRMDEVALSAPELDVDGSPVAVDVVMHGVPVDLDQPVGRVAATLAIDEGSLNRLVEGEGIGELTLGDGTVGYEGSAQVLGLTVDYSATATAEAAGDRVLLTPVDVAVGALGGSLDVSGLVSRLLGDEPVEICTAKYLPEGVRLEGIRVEPGEATVHLGAEQLVLDESTFAAKGSCD